jgi:hypothetical protein
MKEPKLSQNALYEVLVSKVESLESSRQAYDKLYHGITAELNRIESIHKEPISIDTAAVYTATSHVEQSLTQWTCIPRWFLIVFVCSVFSLVLSLCFNYRQHVINLHDKYLIDRCRKNIAALEAELPKKKSKSK